MAVHHTLRGRRRGRQAHRYSAQWRVIPCPRMIGHKKLTRARLAPNRVISAVIGDSRLPRLEHSGLDLIIPLNRQRGHQVPFCSLGTAGASQAELFSDASGGMGISELNSSAPTRACSFRREPASGGSHDDERRDRRSAGPPGQQREAAGSEAQQLRQLRPG